MCSSGSLKASNDGLPMPMGTPCYSPVTLPVSASHHLQPPNHLAVPAVVQPFGRPAPPHDVFCLERQHHCDLVTGKNGGHHREPEVTAERRFHLAAIEVAVLRVCEVHLVETDQ